MTTQMNTFLYVADSVYFIFVFIYSSTPKIVQIDSSSIL